jgi:hypothetical protein
MRTKSSGLTAAGKAFPRLFGSCLCFLLILASPTTPYSAGPTEDKLRDAVIEKIQSDPQTMDLNKDTLVDVTDVTRLLFRTRFPAAAFSRYSTKLTEGSGSTVVNVEFNKPFTGLLRYVVSGTATAGKDYRALSGSVAVNGFLAQIPVQLFDDDELEPVVETITLSLYYVYDQTEALGYIPGNNLQHTIYIEDNDAIWNGTLSSLDSGDGNDTVRKLALDLNFNMRIIRNGSAVSATLVSEGSGVIPANESGWPISPITFTPVLFDGNATMDISKETTLSGLNLVRKFIFHAAGDSVKPDSISGVVTEKLTSASASYFNRTRPQATFVLLKRIPVVEPVEPQGETIP